ncbi:MAG: hypothetical protein JJW01_00035 [Alphaproteobacteria bacterium]|nr:hypothetical protein [Rickettsiales bacterium]
MIIISKWTDVKKAINKNIFSTTIGLLAVISLTIFFFSFWLSFQSNRRTEQGWLYINKIHKNEETLKRQENVKHNAVKMLEHNTKELKTPTIKLLWSLKLLESVKKSDDKVKVTEVMEKIIRIKSASPYIVQLIAIELIHLNIELGQQPSEAAIKIISKIKSKSAIWGLANEALLNILLEKGKTIEHKKKSNNFLQNSHGEIIKRVQEIQEVIKLEVDLSKLQK